MSILKPIDTTAPEKPAPSYSCEAPGCGKVTAAQNTYSLAVVYRMPGPGVPAFQCPNEQHFACCHEHAVQVMQACLNEHIVPLHQQMKTQVALRAQMRAAQQAALEAAIARQKNGAQDEG